MNDTTSKIPTFRSKFLYYPAGYQLDYWDRIYYSIEIECYNIELNRWYTEAMP